MVDGQVQGGGFGGDGAGVVAVGAFGEQPGGVGAEEALQGGRGEAGDVSDGVDPELVQGGGGGAADAGQRGDGAGAQPGVDGGLVAVDVGDAAGRRGGGGHRGEHPVGGQPGAGLDAEQAGDAQLDRLHELVRSFVEVPERRGQIELYGVGRELLKVRGDAAEQFQYLRVPLAGEAAVQVEVGDEPRAWVHPALPWLRWPSFLRSAERVPAGWRSA